MLISSGVSYIPNVPRDPLFEPGFDFGLLALPIEHFNHLSLGQSFKNRSTDQLGSIGSVNAFLGEAQYILSKYPPLPGVLSSPAVPSGRSRGLNIPRLRCCNPARQFLTSRHGASARRGGASIPALDDSLGRTCRRIAGAWR